MSDAEAERVGVRTYVPRYQKEQWASEAEELDMSQAEFVRTMVQAGRRGFEFDDESESTSSNAGETQPSGATPGVDAVETRLLTLLESDTHHSWEELLAGLTDDIEDRLESALSTLQDQNRIKYSGRHGGYTLVDDGE